MQRIAHSDQVEQMIRLSMITWARNTQKENSIPSSFLSVNGEFPTLDGSEDTKYILNVITRKGHKIHSNFSHANLFPPQNRNKLTPEETRRTLQERKVNDCQKQDSPFLSLSLLHTLHPST